jgi:hypothetical protein
VDKAALEQVFLRVLRFPLRSISPIAPHSSSSTTIRPSYSRPVVASVIVDSFPLHRKEGKNTYTNVILREALNSNILYEEELSALCESTSICITGRSRFDSR